MLHPPKVKSNPTEKSNMNVPFKMEDSGMSSDQSTTPENSLSQRPSSVTGGCFTGGDDEVASFSEANNNVASEAEAEAARKVGEVEDTDTDSDLNNSFHQVGYSHYIQGDQSPRFLYSVRSMILR